MVDRWWSGSKLGKTAKKRLFLVFFAPILTKLFENNYKNWTIFFSFNLIFSDLLLKVERNPNKKMKA
jgi:hypothetical protein